MNCRDWQLRWTGWSFGTLILWLRTVLTTAQTLAPNEVKSLKCTCTCDIYIFYAFCTNIISGSWNLSAFKWANTLLQEFLNILNQGCINRQSALPDNFSHASSFVAISNLQTATHPLMLKQFAFKNPLSILGQGEHQLFGFQTNLFLVKILQTLQILVNEPEGKLLHCFPLELFPGLVVCRQRDNLNKHCPQDGMLPQLTLVEWCRMQQAPCNSYLYSYFCLLGRFQVYDRAVTSSMMIVCPTHTGNKFRVSWRSKHIVKLSWWCICHTYVMHPDACRGGILLHPAQVPWFSGGSSSEGVAHIKQEQAQKHNRPSFMRTVSVSGAEPLNEENNLQTTITDAQFSQDPHHPTPMRTAESQGSSFALRRAETFLRDTVTQDQLNALVVLPMEEKVVRDIPDFNSKVTAGCTDREESGMLSQKSCQKKKQVFPQQQK